MPFDSEDRNAPTTRPPEADLARRREASLSPSLACGAGDSIPAFECKFLVDAAAAERVHDYATAHLQRDPHADPARGDSYETTTLYLDTEALDVFHGTPKLEGAKYRVRRYGAMPTVFLERKRRKDDRVTKRRVEIQAGDLTRLTNGERDPKWPGDWFRETVLAHRLRPTCTVTYERTAFFGDSPTGPIRLTLDRRVRGRIADGFDLNVVDRGAGILDGAVICELKFAETMPRLFRELIDRMRLTPSTASKYRRMMTATGAARDDEGKT